MITETDNDPKDQDPKRKSFRLNDLAWVLFFVGMGIFLIFATILVWETWRVSTLNQQFFSR